MVPEQPADLCGPDARRKQSSALQLPCDIVFLCVWNTRTDENRLSSQLGRRSCLVERDPVPFFGKRILCRFQEFLRAFQDELNPRRHAGPFASTGS